jgi:phage-related protein
VTVLRFAGSIGSTIAREIGDLGSTLFNKGKDLIRGFINGIRSMAGAILDAILGILPKSIRGVVSGALGLTRSTRSLEQSNRSTRATTGSGSSGVPYMVTDEQLARAVGSLLMRSGVRNGYVPGVVL